MTALYCVFGNPVAHSRSPDIHHAFAAQRGDDLRYEKREAPLDDFAGAVNAFHEEGGLGANVTVPFKEQAFELCDAVTERAGQAGAVNTLWWDGEQLHGDNTDGAGLVKDIRDNQGWNIRKKRVLILGPAVRCAVSWVRCWQKRRRWCALPIARKTRPLSWLAVLWMARTRRCWVADWIT